mgnify:CR=1 FL=1
MNLVQIVKKARLGVDAILPGGNISTQWGDEELVDLTNEAYGDMLLSFRLVHKKWGMLTVNQDAAAFSRDGETYTPATALQLTSTTSRITLPPDFAEMVRVLCISDRTIRFIPAQMETYHWIDLEQGSRDSTSGSPLPSSPAGLTFYYDILDQRTMFITPPVSTSYDLEIDYIPMKRPLYYSNAGTVIRTTNSTAIAGASTTWVTDGVYSASSGNACEIMVGQTSFTHSSWRLDRDYPRIQAITSDTAATFVTAYAGATDGAGQNYIMAMVPALPREYHPWLARYMSTLMLAKINPELSDKYAGQVMTRFREKIQPASRIRQSQDSMVTEDSEEMGASGTF